MGRKNLLEGLMRTELTAGNSARDPALEVATNSPAVAALALAGARGAIGAVTRSIEQLKAHSVLEIDPELVDPSLVADRLDHSEEHHRTLVESIRAHGQQVPALLRPHPDHEGRFQIAYGRRRLHAVKELGRKLRAIVKPLSDAELVVAQGQENSARKDLTFIEKALFAARLEQGGYNRETIMAALSVDKTGLSRLISSAVRIPVDIIESIGPAPAVGRDRWVALSERLERAGDISRAREAIAHASFTALNSDERFQRVFDAVASKAARVSRASVLRNADGARIGAYRADAAATTLTFPKKLAGDFAAYLIETLPQLHANYLRDMAKAPKGGPGN